MALNPDKITYLDFKMQSGTEVSAEVTVVDDRVTFSKDKTSSKVSKRSAKSSAMENFYFDEEAEESSSASRNDEVVMIDGYESSTNITSIEYKIDIPYSIPSDGKDYMSKSKK